jgi:hypothetical protein
MSFQSVLHLKKVRGLAENEINNIKGYLKKRMLSNSILQKIKVLDAKNLELEVQVNNIKKTQ